MALTAEAVVIGGGIIGCATAYYLAKLGCQDVILLEKEGIASGATGLCTGGVRQQWGTEINCLMGKMGLAFYQRINEELEPEHKILFQQDGYLFLAYSLEELQKFQACVKLQNKLGISSQLLTPEEVLVLVPGVQEESLLGGAYCATDGHAQDPHYITFCFLEAAKRLGVRVIFKPAVEIQLARDQITGVRLGDGTDISTPQIINAAGMEAAQVGKMVGLDLPVRATRRPFLFTKPFTKEILRPLLVCFNPRVVLKQFSDKTMIILASPPQDTEKEQIKSGWDFVVHASETAVQVLPPMQNLEVMREAFGLRSMTPDYQAILGHVDGLKGYYLSVGWGGHGFMMAPPAGQLLAELILSGTSSLSIEPLNLRRFQTGELLYELLT